MKRTGTIKFSASSSNTTTQQAIVSKRGRRDVKNTTVRNLTGSTTNDKTDTSTDSKKSVEHANIAFRMAFSIPILGRVPATSGTSC